jgi:hypothetical protein
MYRKTKMLFTIAVLLCVPLSVLAANCKNISSTDKRAYKDRGDRCEGIHPQLVSGYDIELISAMANYREPTKGLPEYFKLKFCLPEGINDVHVKVRELEYEHYYRMDKPRISWDTGCSNFFQWSTDAVIKHLRGLNMSDLAVLVRLGKQRPSVKEEVAPVIFYHSKSPNNISGYLFTLKTNRDAKLKYSIRNEETRQTVVTRSNYLRTRSNKPFQIGWDNAPTQNGSYKLNLKGYFISNGESIRQSIRFYHQSRIR